jgi:hypothetical protein
VHRGHWNENEGERREENRKVEEGKWLLKEEVNELGKRI